MDNSIIIKHISIELQKYVLSKGGPCCYSQTLFIENNFLIRFLKHHMLVAAQMNIHTYA